MSITTLSTTKHYDAVLSLRKRKTSPFKKLSPIGEGVTPDLNTQAIGVTSRQIGVKSRHYIWATMFVVATTIFYMYPIGVLMLNAKFPAGYQSVSPKVYVSSRYGLEWWLLCVLSWNILLPYVLSIALVNNNIPEWARLHFFLGRLTIMSNGIIFLLLSINWIFLCNNGFFPHSTFCNDPRYCCVYFGSSQSNIAWCANAGPCSPDVSGSSLYRSDEFFQMWLFCIFFWALSFSHRSINQELTSFGFFRESNTKIEEEEEGEEKVENIKQEEEEEEEEPKK